MQHELGIIIVHYNQWELLIRCLQALGKANKPDDTILTVIDNASLPIPAEEVKREMEEAYGRGELRLIRNEQNIGFGAACNLGFQAMDCAYYYILNPDVEGRPETVTELMNAHREHPRAGIVGPQLIYTNGTIQDSYRRFPRLVDQVIKRTPLRKSRLLRQRVRRYLMWDKEKEKTEQVDWLVGACLMIKDKALKEVGAFDERFFLFYEDVDLCRRMGEKGWSVIYHPHAKATHHHERLSAGGILSILTKKTLRIHLMSALKYFWKWRKGDQSI